MSVCALCGKQIKDDDLTDFTGLFHLFCSIQELGGCADVYGTFLYCFECWKPCCYRQALPISDLVILQRLWGKGRFFMSNDNHAGR